MKVIKVLGTGCPSCVSTEKVVAEVVNQLNIEAKIEKVTDIMEIMAYDVMSTPAIVINEVVVFKGNFFYISIPYPCLFHNCFTFILSYV